MQFTIDSSEDLPIRGNLDVPADPRALVVVVHGFKGFKDWGFFPWAGERLSEHDIAVCRFNMSRCGVGESGDSFDRLDLFEDDTYSIELADLSAVVRYAQQRVPELPTFLLGHSRGGGIAILGACEMPDLHGVIAWSPIASSMRWDPQTIQAWRKSGSQEIVNQRTRQVMRMSTKILDDCERNRDRLDILKAVETLEVPLLVVHGGRDDSVPSDEGRQIASRAADASLVIIEQASHTFNAIHPLVDVPFELLLATELSAHFIRAHA